jgi:hypothetical protein
MPADPGQYDHQLSRKMFGQRVFGDQAIQFRD